MSKVTQNRAIGYCRVSSTQQAQEGVSLDAQKARITAYCVAEGLPLLAILEDSGISGKTLDRPGLRAALALLQANAANTLVVTKLDRLSRSLKDIAELIDRYFGQTYSLVSLSEKLDGSTATGRLMVHLIASISEWERGVISERTASSLQYLKSQGVKIGAPAYGQRMTDELDSDGRRIVVADVEELQTIARVHQLRAEGKTLAAICKVLEVEGRKPKRAGRFYPKTVRDMLLRTKSKEDQAA